MHSRGGIPWIVLACLALGGLAVERLSTGEGIGLSPDSLGYMGAAYSIREGKGLTIPWGGGPAMTHWPPLFPAVLAGIGCVSLGSLSAGAWLNGVLFAVNIFLLGGIVHWAAGKRWCAILAAFLMLASTDLISVHAWIWSEPLFVCFCLLFLHLIHRYVEDAGTAMLLAASVAASLAMLTRYAGVALIGAGIVAIFLLGPKPLHRRLRDCAVLMAASFAPLAAWLIRNSLAGGTSTNRALAWHPVTHAQLLDGFGTVSAWMVPGRLPALLQGAAVIAAAAVFAMAVPVLLSKRRREVLDKMQVRWKCLCLFSIFAAAYAAFIIVSISVFDANTPLDSRILAPVHVAGAAFAVCCAGLLWDVWRPAGIVVLLLIAAVAVRGTAESSRWVAQRSIDGCGYTTPEWQNSPLTHYLRGLRPDSPVYTNVPGVVFFHLGKKEAYRLPSKVRLGEARPNENFRAELNAMRDDLVRRGGVIAYYYRGEMEGLPPGGELREELPLKIVAQYPNETAYAINEE